ncbi:23244_t:CDS:2, partial [Dentiscutata erythropus]
RRTLECLYELAGSQNSATQQHPQFKWIKSKWNLNKKKDTFWHLIHKALPLEHFVLKCLLSRIIWESAYKALKTLDNETTPYTLIDIFQATNIKGDKKHEAAIWLHIICVMVGLKGGKKPSNGKTI